MTKDNSNTITPIIRFQGFNGEWKKKKIGDIAIVLQGYGFPEKYQGQKYGDLPFCKVGDISSAVDRGEMVINKADNFVDYSLLPVLHAQPIPVGSTIFAKIGEAIRSNKRIKTGVPCLIDNNAAAVKSKGEISDTFLFYLMSKVNLADYSGGIVPSVNKSTIEAIDVLVPSSRDEQQKIAECLEAIDQMISAQNQKVESLKAHKKGLMQQFFPQPGATTPALRFPGFTGDWQFVNGDKLFEPISNKKHNSDLPILALTQDQGAVPREMINYNVVVSDKSVTGYKVVEVDDFIISLRSFQGGIEYSRYKGLCSPAYIVLRKKDKTLSSDFYRIYFKSFNYIQNLNKNLEGIRDGKMISYQQFSEIMLPLPTAKEQIMIANCISSLDEVILSESQKLESLKTHKKGLMQQLFPQFQK